MECPNILQFVVSVVNMQPSSPLVDLFMIREGDIFPLIFFSFSFTFAGYLTSFDEWARSLCIMVGLPRCCVYNKTICWVHSTKQECWSHLKVLKIVCYRQIWEPKKRGTVQTWCPIVTCWFLTSWDFLDDIDPEINGLVCWEVLGHFSRLILSRLENYTGW